MQIDRDLAVKTPAYSWGLAEMRLCPLSVAASFSFSVHRRLAIALARQGRNARGSAGKTGGAFVRSASGAGFRAAGEADRACGLIVLIRSSPQLSSCRAVRICDQR